VMVRQAIVRKMRWKVAKLKNIYHKVPKDVIPEEIVIQVCWYPLNGKVVYDKEYMTDAFERALDILPKRRVM
jgi:hypothetical protein